MEEDKTSQAKFGTDKTEESTQMIRNMLMQIERKTEEDIAQRQKDTNELKTQFEQKLIGMVEKIKLDEKQGLDRERRLMEQVQDGLNTMNEIIKGTRE